MSRGRAMAAVAIAAALGAIPPAPEVFAPPVPLPEEPEGAPVAPGINPKTGLPYRGIPAHAERRADPVRMRYADGPQPDGIAKMLQERRRQQASARRTMRRANVAVVQAQALEEAAGAAE